MWRWLLVVACGCGDDRLSWPSGEHRRFVIDHETVWTTSTVAELSLDLTPAWDGPDNRLGAAFATLARERIRFVQRDVDAALRRRDVVEVLDLQIPEGEGYGRRAGFALQSGLDDGAVPAEPLVMHFEDQFQGHFFASDRPGALSIRIGLFDSVFELELLDARAEVTDPRVYPARVAGKIAGGVAMDDVLGQLLPAFHAMIVDAIARDCSQPQSPPLCGCAEPPDELQGGAYFVRMFDSPTKPELKDCAVMLEELASNVWVYNQLYADLRVDGRAAMSFGFRFSAAATP